MIINSKKIKSQLLTFGALITACLTSSATELVKLETCEAPIANLIIKPSSCEATLCKDQGLWSRWKKGSAEDISKKVNNFYGALLKKSIENSHCFNLVADKNDSNVLVLNSTVKAFETDETGLSLSAGTLVNLATGNIVGALRGGGPSADLKVGSAKLTADFSVTDFSANTKNQFGDYSSDVSRFNPGVIIPVDIIAIGGDIPLLGSAKAKAFAEATQDVVNSFVIEYKSKNQ